MATIWTCRRCGHAWDAVTDWCEACETARNARPGEMVPCSLADYCRIVRALPRPSEEQIVAYVQFVARAHSWYKHLPLVAPGFPFRFFLNPCAGMALRGWMRERPASGSYALSHEERTVRERPFHYTWMTTTTYVERFGYLEYDIGPSPNRPQTPDHYEMLSKGPIVGIDDTLFRVPAEILEMTTVELTGVIHEFSAEDWLWDRLLRGKWQPRLSPEVLANPVFERVRSVRREFQVWADVIESDEQAGRLLFEHANPRAGYTEALKQVLRTERERQSQAMLDAIHRMLAYVYDENEIG